MPIRLQSTWFSTRLKSTRKFFKKKTRIELTPNFVIRMEFICASLDIQPFSHHHFWPRRLQNIFSLSVAYTGLKYDKKSRNTPSELDGIRNRSIRVLWCGGAPQGVVRHLTHPSRHSTVQISYRQWTAQICKSRDEIWTVYCRTKGSNVALEFQILCGPTWTDDSGRMQLCSKLCSSEPYLCILAWIWMGIDWILAYLGIPHALCSHCSEIQTETVWRNWTQFK